jgi:hypothetical protein
MWLWATLLLIALGAAACGGDGGEKPASTVEPIAAAGGAGGGLSLEGGLDLNLGTSGLPGCANPSDDACLVPLSMDLDGEMAAGGVSLRYPARYFEATSGEGDVLITLTPSENYQFAERAVFEVSFAASVETALAVLAEPETAPWTAGGLSGTIGVVCDDTQDPPLNTTIGAFALEDGRAVVLTLTTTGKDGWYRWSQVYAAMLDTLAVSAP